MTTHDDEIHDRFHDEPASERHGGEDREAGEARRERRGEGDERERGRRGRHHRRHHGRKERVLHTRISEQLADDIRRLADDLRVPTSNLVRNVLEEVFTMVESVSEDMGELFEEVLDEAEETRRRVRSRAERSRRRHHRRRHRSPSRSRASAERFDDAVEEELRRDEAREFAQDAPPATDARAEPEVARRERPEFPDVIGWQPLVLNREQTCASCGVDLPRGVRAFVGVTEQGISGTTLCRPCTGIR